MAQLRQYLTDHGFKDVKTYIQSGNVIFKSETITQQQLEVALQRIILDDFNLEVPVLVATHEELQIILDNCPFKSPVKEQSYFVILNKIPNAQLVAEASQKTYPNDTYHILKNCIYFYPEKGYGRSKFNMNYFEKTLRVSATARNYKTLTKLLEMSAS